MKHTTYVQLCYDHKSFATAKDAFVEVEAEDGQLLTELAEKAKQKLCETIHLPVEEVSIHDYRVYHELPLIIKEPAAAEKETHARWVSLPGYYTFCSHCNMSCKEIGRTPYCPYCGAKMDLEI